MCVCVCVCVGLAIHLASCWCFARDTIKPVFIEDCLCTARYAIQENSVKRYEEAVSKFDILVSLKLSAFRRVGRLHGDYRQLSTSGIHRERGSNQALKHASAKSGAATMAVNTKMPSWGCAIRDGVCADAWLIYTKG